MAKNRRPKKALIQLGIALVVAVILGIIGVMTTFGIINSAVTGSEEAKQAALEEKERLQAELEAVREKVDTEKKVLYSELKAVRDISSGEPISRDMVIVETTEEKSDATALKRLSEAVGKIAANDILAGETLTRTKVARPDSVMQVPEGQRAITISVGGTASVDGEVKPGSNVDILVTLKDKNGSEITKTLLQNTKVIAVGGNTSSSSRATSKANSVTVAVTPENAEMLTLAGNVGEFHLTLRNYKDTETANVTGTDVVQLLTGAKPEVDTVLPPPPEMIDLSAGMHSVNEQGDPLPQPGGPNIGIKQHTMEIYKGSGSETVVFD